MKKTIYIAGPMAHLPLLNFPAFYKAEEQLEKVGMRFISYAR